MNALRIIKYSQSLLKYALLKRIPMEDCQFSPKIFNILLPVNPSVIVISH